ncbi:hypothetical protein [Furfurilactobacillus siliginis]|nr:hypothetical protein [Furfurilactobacillus siliginis]GEK28498.1 hypothetical protein LSI01_08090 [Furfurilactobacillus siliginis]
MAKRKVELNIANLKGGAVQEQIDSAMKEVTKNVLDPNTDFKKARKLTVTLTFKPNEDRDTIATSVDVKSTLAPHLGINTTVLMGRDANTGSVEAQELKSGTKGQTYFDPDDETLKTDTGDDIDQVEKDNKPIDFRKRKVEGQ